MNLLPGASWAQGSFPAFCPGVQRTDTARALLTNHSPQYRPNGRQVIGIITMRFHPVKSFFSKCLLHLVDAAFEWALPTGDEWTIRAALETPALLSVSACEPQRRWHHILGTLAMRRRLGDRWGKRGP